MSIQHLKLIVTPTANCRRVLQYFDKNIVALNRMNVQLHIEKIAAKEFDEVVVGKLQRKGISRLPALITQSNRSYIGYDEIIEACEQHLRNKVVEDRLSVNMGGAENLTDYMHDAIMANDDAGDDDGIGEGHSGRSLERKMSEYNNMRMARQSQQPPGRSRRPHTAMDESPPRRRRAGRNDDPNREYAPGDGETPRHTERYLMPIETRGATLDEQRDNDMVNSWLANNIDLGQ